MNCDSCHPATVPSPVVLQNVRKRSLSPAPVDVRNGEPVPKMSRSLPVPHDLPETEVQAIELLQELVHRQVPFDTLWPVASRSPILVNALDPSARALLQALQRGTSLGMQQRAAFNAGLQGAMAQSGLFEPVG
ncbi:hypothetical protein [Stenotrophomonas bentonitica]|uniref:hypothetical protein n=1 Tax=Stenotrophomonas bentonitica TaxID=1450134 RepID=UPI00345E177C